MLGKYTTAFTKNLYNTNMATSAINSNIHYSESSLQLLDIQSKIENLDDIPTIMNNQLLNATEGILDSISNIVKRIGEYIRKFFMAIYNKVKDIINSIIRFFRKLFGIKSPEDRIETATNIIKNTPENEVTVKCKKIVDKLRTIKFRIIDHATMKKINSLANQYLNEGMDLTLNSLKDYITTGQTKSNYEIPLKTFMEKYTNELNNEITKKYIIGTSKEISADLDGIAALKLALNIDMNSELKLENKEDAIKLFRSLITNMNEHFKKLEERDYKLFEKLAHIASDQGMMEHTVIAMQKYQLPEQAAQLLAQNYCQTVLRFSRIITTNVNNLTVLFNSTVKLFENEFGLLDNKRTVITPNDIKEIQDILDNTPSIDTVEGYNVYKSSAMSPLLIKFIGNQAQTNELIKMINKQIGAWTIAASGSIKPLIVVNDATIDLVGKHLKAIEYHEYGHIKNNDINRLNEFLLQKGYDNPTGRVAALLFSGMYRPLKNEIRADSVAVENCGVDDVLGFINIFINHFGNAIQYNKLTKDKSSSIITNASNVSHLVTGKYEIDSDIRLPMQSYRIRTAWRNDLFDRKTWWEKYKNNNA